MNTDIEDLVPSGRSQIVVEFSRRTDYPAFGMNKIVEALENQTITYRNPMPMFSKSTNPKAFCTVDLDPSTVFAISWFSKDYSEFLKAYHDQPELFKKYKHHFCFTINAFEKHSRLEPGLRTDLRDRLRQLESLVEIALEQDEDPNNSIQVRYDPIVVYDDLKSDEKNLDNCTHLDYLFPKMNQLGLTRLHFSFLQLSPWPKIAKRALKYHSIRLFELTTSQKKEFLTTRVLLLASKYNIRLETCSAPDLMNWRDDVKMGACVPRSSIEAIGHPSFRLSTKKRQNTNKKVNSEDCYCTCVNTRDVGYYDPKCKHGCVYCFAAPVM